MMIHGVQPKNATRCKLGCERREHRARRRVRRSSFRLVSTLSAAAHAHYTLAADDTHRANALTKLQLAAKLVQPPIASTGAECSNPAPR